jgi:hypothetical protein
MTAGPDFRPPLGGRIVAVSLQSGAPAGPASSGANRRLTLEANQRVPANGAAPNGAER